MIYVVMVLVYGILLGLFWMFLRGVLIFNEEGEVCNEPQASCLNCRKCR